MDGYKLFWGDSHTNLHSRHLPGLATSLAQAREMLDFWPLAYYPQEIEPRGGFYVEDWLPQDRLDRDWKAVCDFAAANNQPGRLVIFPGYEWQGDGRCGDHNVFFLEDHPPLIRCSSLAELYDGIRRGRLKAYAIPHHTAYMAGVRGKDWDVHDEGISPFAEIFSNHGCSESDEEWIGLRANRHMGPGVSGGTIEEALNRGHRLGIICSGDSHYGIPAVYGWGLMACYAKELSRESLWEAFAERRVYGVSADRIELEFTVEGAMMGAVIRHKGPVRALARVRGCDALDRIELLRNNRVIATHCHNGSWEVPTGGERIRCKLRVEAGWGARPETLGDLPDRDWDCWIEIPDGQVLAAERCWRTAGQWVGEIGGPRCEFGFRTAQRTPDNIAASNVLPNEAAIFELAGRPSDTVRLNVAGKGVSMTLAEAMRGSRIVHFMDEAAAYVQRRFGVDPDTLPRADRFYFYGHKAKVHRAIPEAGFAASMDHLDAAPPGGVNFYRVRVTQRNGSVAWSSPVWVRNE